MPTFSNLRKSENIHIVLWLFKDICWVQDWRLLGTIILGPTVIIAAWIAWRSRRDLSELLHSLAVVFWICANGIWMLGEFHCEDCTRPMALVFFVLGISCVARWYLWPRSFRASAPGQ